MERRFGLGLSLGLLAWNDLVHALPGTDVAYVPLNLAATGVVLGAARAHGLTATDLGLRRDRVRSGLRWGAGVAAVVAGGLAVAGAVPGLRPLLDDARVRRLGPGGVAYHAAVRVPLGTVVLEEVAFRGALYGALARTTDRLRAAALSSAVFGLWHVRPTLGLLAANDLGGGPAARAGAVAGAAVATAAGGMLLCGLRAASGSTVAPAVVHVATNSLGILASALAR